MKFQKIKLTEEQRAELKSYKESKECSGRETRRIIAILLLDKKFSEDVIKDLTGFSRGYIFELRKKYLSKGIIALKDPKGAKPRLLLTKGQREEVITLVTTKTPLDHGYETVGWTTSILGAIIKEKYNVQYKSKTSLRLIFKEAKFTYHKPGRQYKNKNQERNNEWVKKHKDIINEEMNNPGTVVLYADEMMLSTQTTTQKIWLLKNHYPRIDVSSNRNIRVVYGFLNVKTGQEHAFKSKIADSDATIAILEEIGALYPDKKIVIIWDNASYHRSQTMKDYLSTTKYHFHLIALPPYSPELNPQEHVWKAGRMSVTHNKYIPDIDKAADELISYLNTTLFRYKLPSLLLN